MEKVMSLALSAAMVFSLAACSADTVSQGEKAETAGESAAAEKTYDGIFDENGISKPGEFPISKEPVTLRVFVGQEPGVVDITKHSIFKEISEKQILILILLLRRRRGRRIN